MSHIDTKSPPLRRDDLDVVGDLFGLKFVSGGVVIHVEDDGWWHPKLTVDRAWLKDLKKVAAAGMQHRKG